MSTKFLIVSLTLAHTLTPAVGSAGPREDIAELRQQIELMKRDYEARIDALEARLQAAETAAPQTSATARKAEALNPPAVPSALDAALAEIESLEAAKASTAPPRQDLWSRRIGAAEARLIDVSLIANLAAGWSTADNDAIELLQGGEHDPKRRGFTLQQAELALAGAVDPYFTANAFMLFSEEGVELEEAFFTTTSLPADLQVEGGFFLTEFGRTNPRHLHEWDWIDQPVINNRLFGGEGARAAGIRLSWLLPTPWYSEFHVGAQDPTNETLLSFLGEGHGHGEEGDNEDHDHAEETAHGGVEADEFEETVGGFARVKNDVDNPADLLYLLRWVNSGDVNPQTSAQLGLSALFGPNASGDDGDTAIYGTDFLLKWRPADNFRGWPFANWETEIMRRDFDIDRNNPVFADEDELRDWGLYSQVMYGFKHPWAAGLRVEFAGGSGEGEEERDEDPQRSDRLRISPLLVWHPTEFSRIRLQYNYDDADFLDGGKEHTVWLGAEVSLGAHGPHKY